MRVRDAIRIFFSAKALTLTKSKGASRLATALRKRFVAKALSVYEINIKRPAVLKQSALKGQRFHGIWTCASLLTISI